MNKKTSLVTFFYLRLDMHCNFNMENKKCWFKKTIPKEIKNIRAPNKNKPY